MEKNKIIITNPCNKNWNDMIPKKNGKHCNACDKTVIDFTTWEVEEIEKYLLTKNEKVCGHFRSLQVAVIRPKHHQFLVDLYLNTEAKIKMPFVKTFILTLIVICMIVVGCNRPSADKVSIPQNYETELRGDVATPPDVIPTEKDTNERMLKGMVATPTDVFPKVQDTTTTNGIRTKDSKVKVRK